LPDRCGFAAMIWAMPHSFAFRPALLALFFAASAALAPQTVLAQAGAACVSGGNTEQTNACAVQAFQQADTDNNILYADVMRILSAHERPALRRDQNEWIRQRAATCKKQQAAHAPPPTQQKSAPPPPTRPSPTGRAATTNAWWPKSASAGRS